MSALEAAQNKLNVCTSVSDGWQKEDGPSVQKATAGVSLLPADLCKALRKPVYYSKIKAD